MAANHSAICASLSRKKNERMIAENADEEGGRVLTAIAPSDASTPLTTLAVLRAADVADVDAVRPAGAAAGNAGSRAASIPVSHACTFGRVARAGCSPSSCI